MFIHIWIQWILFPLQNDLNLQKISLICLNLEVYKFVIEIKPYNTLITLVITDCLLICILFWKCPKQHICTRKVHPSRVWNKQNAIQPAIPISPAGEWITLPTDSMRAYFDLCIIKYFLNVISPNNDMQSKLTWLFIRFPEIDLKALGFPQRWETEPLWR